DLQAAAAGDLQPAVVQAEQPQYRGVQVGDVVALPQGVVAQLVGRAVDVPPPQPRPGQPDGEPVGVVVAAGPAAAALLQARRPPGWPGGPGRTCGGWPGPRPPG